MADAGSCSCRPLRRAPRPQTARRSGGGLARSFNSSCPTASASITTAPRSFNSAGHLTLAAANPPDEPDHGQRAMPERRSRAALELIQHGLIDGSLPSIQTQAAGSHDPRNQTSIVSGRASSSRDPSGHFDARRRETVITWMPPRQSPRKQPVRTLGLKECCWAARNVIHANVENWLNQVGFLKVLQPSSLIQGFSKHRRNRGRGGQA